MSENYTVLKLSRLAFDEIKQRLKESGQDDRFYDDANEGELIDMHGIALAIHILPDLSKGRRIHISPKFLPE
jgi:hypothetical protein